MKEISLFVSICWPLSRIRTPIFWEAGRNMKCKNPQAKNANHVMAAAGEVLANADNGVQCLTPINAANAGDKLNIYLMQGVFRR